MMRQASGTRRKTMAITQEQAQNKIDINQSSSSTARLAAVATQRKASTPTHDKTARTESPDVSRIMPAEICSTNNSKPTAPPAPGPVTEQVLSLSDQISLEYTQYLQTMLRRKIAEAKVNDEDVSLLPAQKQGERNVPRKLDDRLMLLQKRIMDNQNLLEKTTARLKNINFNKEVETLHKLKNPNYRRVLETLDKENCKEYLETVNRKLEQNQNQLKMKNIELPESASSELLQIVKDTVAACEKLKSNNYLAVPKVIEDIKVTNKNTSETLARSVEMLPEAENLILDKTTLEISAKFNH